MRARYDVYEPIHLIIDELPIQLMPEISEGLEEELKAEIAANVVTTGYQQTTTKNTGSVVHNDYWRNGWEGTEGYD